MCGLSIPVPVLSSGSNFELLGYLDGYPGIGYPGTLPVPDTGSERPGAGHTAGMAGGRVPVPAVLATVSVGKWKVVETRFQQRFLVWLPIATILCSVISGRP